jgi:hypothetical protein
MNAKAGTAEQNRDAALNKIMSEILVIPELDAESHAHLEKANQPLSLSHKTYRAALISRRDLIIADGQVPDLLIENPVAAMLAESLALQNAAKDARALATSSGDAAALKTEHAELLGRKSLYDNKSELKRRIDIHQQIAKIQKAIKVCGTKDISDHGSKLLKVHVTEELKDALTDEQINLGLTSIPIVLSDRTPKGAIHHRLRLNDATLAADTSSVLSEGEHRAVALAAFLSELKMYPGKDAIIIDDPVSSLDHIRRGKVAERMVTEAKDRQVIVFTHDLVFLSEVRFFAAKKQTQLQVLGIKRGPNGFGSRDPDGEPWTTKSIPGRKQWLTQQLAKLKPLHLAASDDYEPQLRFFYDRLRESWERLVEEKLFNEVVTRFQPQVQTLRLREAVFDDDIFAQINFGMSAVSNYTGHDKAAAKGGTLADPHECERDLDAFTKCIGDIDALAKEVAKTRAAKIKPPKTA